MAHAKQPVIIWDLDSLLKVRQEVAKRAYRCPDAKQRIEGLRSLAEYDRMVARLRAGQEVVTST